MTAEPLIELGDIGTPRPVPDRPGRPAVPRWLPLVAAGLLVLLGTAGSAVPRPGLVPLATLPYAVGAISVLGTDTVFVDARGTLSGYDLDSGARRWSVPVPGETDGMLLAESMGVLLLGLSDPPVGTLAFDARTGRLLWRIAGEQPGTLLPGQRMALLYTVGPVESSRVRGVDVRTGGTVWVRTQPATVAYFGPWVDTSVQPPRLVFEAADRSVEVVDAATGVVVARGHLPGVPPPDPATTEGRAALSVVGALLVASYGDESHRMSAFDLDTLAPKWTVTLPAGGVFATACGPVLCVFGTQTLTGLDPATGVRRWFTRAWNDAANPLRGDRLLVQSGDQTQQSAIVAAADLRPVLRLGDWDPFVDQRPGGPVLLARDVSSLWTWFAVVDPSAARPVVRPLGRAYGVFRQDCSARGGYLVCPTVHNELQVWRYRW